MTNDPGSNAASRGPKSTISMSLGLIGVVLVFVAGGVSSFWNIHVLNQDSLLVVHAQQVMRALDDVLSNVKDAETGQRGYVITGKDEYLEPYNSSLLQIDGRMAALARLTEGNQTQQERIRDMNSHIRAKLLELAETIQLRRTKGFDSAQAVVLSDSGKNEMDALRADIGSTKQEEVLVRDARIAEMASAYHTAVGSVCFTGLLGMFLSLLVARQVKQATTTSRQQEWLQAGQVGLNAAMSGVQRMNQLAENILRFTAEYLDAHAGAFFGKDGDEFQRIETYGVADKSNILERFSSGDGLLGQAAKDKRTIEIRDVPDGYLTVSSGFGSAKPRNLILLPAVMDETVFAVLELGFVHPLNKLTTEFLSLAARPIGIAVRSAHDRARLQDLLEETQRQGEDMQAQTEELRVANDELEEQSRFLKESQAILEEQQDQLTHSNVQLEEQAQLLEAQRDDLNGAKESLELQAVALERTIRFKSEFLANMSHELRTPLNSTLILAKLLGDNREGNLTAEQVKYAQTIHSAGNDLLALISDILDLSKIEAGHMEMEVQTVRTVELADRISRMFAPIAADKSIGFQIVISPDTPEAIETDPQRLEQVIKNLLSNAIKFTARGQVSLSIHSVEGGLVCFSVSDTGIGIPLDQHEMIFEAFRQADGTTNRKYGGTGLGLSISRQLTHLLGGEIVLTSNPGQGSTFSIAIPAIAGPAVHWKQAAETLQVPTSSLRDLPIRASVATFSMQDDRDDLTENDRAILIVEDDVKFARILYDLAHEHGFKCLIANSGEAGLALASQFVPSAVLLDIGLPDQSGLSVLDLLKHDPRTRHIPVHVVSGSDSSRTALALGAIGYFLKPVKSEELAQAFEALETRLTQRLRRVLLVEDDAVQLDSLRLLLGSSEVDTVGVSSAAECLELLRTTSFDCMVLDLTLPDASGFSLLKTLSEGEAYSFPPVVVYTGRELSTDEEQLLRRYSKSITVKGAKSPERLLDEVTLFLHQVVKDLPVEKQRLIAHANYRDGALEERLILVVEDDIRNIFALTSILEPRGAKVEIARNGFEALKALELSRLASHPSIDLVLMDIMMPEMDGYEAMREIRKRPEWTKLPIIALTAKAMASDQAECVAAGANDYIAKPLDVEKLLSLIRVWMPR